MNGQRQSGISLNPCVALSAPCVCSDFGEEAFNFIDFLARVG